MWAAMSKDRPERLARFAGAWVTKRLGDVADFAPGDYLPSSDYRPGRFEVQGAGGPMGRHDRPNQAAAHSVIGRVGTVGRPRFMRRGCWVNNNAGAVVARAGCVIPEYLHSVLLSLDWMNFCSVTAQPFLSVEALLSFRMPVPSLPEQRAIAAVLSDVDAEIGALERRLDKTRAIRQGVTQQLLTGSIRLPIPDHHAEDDDTHAA